MDDILKKLRQKKKRDKDSSPLGSIFGDVVKGDSEDEAEDEMEITHHDTKVHEDVVPKGEGLRKMDLEDKPAGPVDILGGDGIRELSEADLTVRHPEDDNVESSRKPSQTKGNIDQDGNEIVLKTRDKSRVQFLKLVVALLESGYYDQAIETIHELRKAIEH